MYRAKVQKILAEKLELKGLRFMKKWQRRSERISISIMGTVVEQVGQASFSHEVDIANISVDGIYFETTDVIQNEKDLIIYFKVGSQKMSLPLKIVRKLNLEKNIYGYGCKITHSPPTFAAILNTFSDCSVLL